MSDFDDLLSASPRKKIGRPSKADLAAREEATAADLERKRIMGLATRGVTQIDERQFFNPVGVNFLRRVLGMDPQTIRTRLRTLPPLEGSHPSRPVWHFHETLPYLIKPKMTAEQFARTLNKADLPPEINKSFWDSQRSRVKYKIEAQEAWETEDVMQVLGDVAMTIKDSLTMVVEEMRNRAKLTDEQTELFQVCIDEIRTELRKKLVELPAKRQTASMFGKPMFGVSGNIDTTPDVPDDTGWYGDEEDEDEA